MIPVSIHAEIKRAVPALALGCVSATVKVEKLNERLWTEINRLLVHLFADFKPDHINSIPQIAAMRAAYKALGKDPSRYRGSAEALLRRVLSGKGLYQINNVVDINNLVSLESLQPLGSYDLDRISRDIELRIGGAGETYKGIGKDMINIESLPVFADADGPFGSPTSDSERAMVRADTSKVLMVVFSFNGPDSIDAWTARAGDLLRHYAGGASIDQQLLL